MKSANKSALLDMYRTAEQQRDKRMRRRIDDLLRNGGGYLGIDEVDWGIACALERRGIEPVFFDVLHNTAYYKF